jgi:hypothetical protein
MNEYVYIVSEPGYYSETTYTLRPTKDADLVFIDEVQEASGYRQELITYGALVVTRPHAKGWWKVASVVTFHQTV